MPPELGARTFDVRAKGSDRGHLEEFAEHGRSVIVAAAAKPLAASLCGNSVNWFPVVRQELPVPRNSLPVNFRREFLEKLLQHRSSLL